MTADGRLLTAEPPWGAQIRIFRRAAVIRLPASSYFAIAGTLMLKRGKNGFKNGAEAVRRRARKNNGVYLAISGR